MNDRVSDLSFVNEYTPSKFKCWNWIRKVKKCIIRLFKFLLYWVLVQFYVLSKLYYSIANKNLHLYCGFYLYRKKIISGMVWHFLIYYLPIRRCMIKCDRHSKMAKVQFYEIHEIIRQFFQLLLFFSFLGPTIVYFHVTVMGLDSIDETSMVTSEK